jgi:hypothetical protein
MARPYSGLPGVPDDWSVSGNRPIKQQVTLDTGRDDKRCGKLECSEWATNCRPLRRS